MMLVHHHLLYQASVGRTDLGENANDRLEKFLYTLLDVIDMQELIPAKCKFSDQKARTGLIGIITSHISFHYWTQEQYLQLDIYSCKSFDKEKAVLFLNDFRLADNIHTLFIDREAGKKFEIQET